MRSPPSPAAPACRSGKIDSSPTVFDHLAQSGVTDWEFVDGRPRTYRLRGGGARRQARLPPAGAGAPRPPAPPHQSPGAAAGRGPAAIPIRGHLRRAGARGRGSGLGRRQKKASARVPAGTTSGARRRSPPTWPHPSVIRSMSPPTSRTAPRPRSTPRPRRWPSRSPGRLPNSTGSRRETRAARERRLSPSTAWAHRSTASTPSRPPGTATTRHRVHDLVRGDRAAGAQPVRADHRRVPADRAAAGWSSPRSATPRTRSTGPGEAGVPVAVRRLRQRLGAHGAGRRRQGPRHDDRPRGRRRGAGRLRAGRSAGPT